MTTQTASAHCRYYRASMGTCPALGSCQPAYVPLEHCDVHETYVSNLNDSLPPLVFGPDGGLVARETCTVTRFQRSCRPALERLHVALPEETVYTSSEAVREQAVQLRSLAASARSRAHGVLTRAQALMDRAQAALDRSLATQARHQALGLAA